MTMAQDLSKEPRSVIAKLDTHRQATAVLQIRNSSVLGS